MRKYLPIYFSSFIKAQPKKLVSAFCVLFALSFLSAETYSFQDSLQTSNDSDAIEQQEIIEVENISNVLYISEGAQVVGLKEVFVKPQIENRQNAKIATKTKEIEALVSSKVEKQSVLIEKNKINRVRYVLENSGETSVFKNSNSISKLGDRVQRVAVAILSPISIKILLVISDTVSADNQNQFLVHTQHRTFRVRPPPISITKYIS